MQPPRSSSATSCSTRNSGSSGSSWASGSPSTAGSPSAAGSPSGSSWATGSPSAAGSPSGSSWATGSPRDDEDLEKQSSETLSSEEDDDFVGGRGLRKGENAYARYEDEGRGGATAAMRQRRQRRQQREQLRPGCCQTVLLLIPALLVKATGCIVETCRGCCGGSTQRGALGHHRRRRDKPAPKYKSVRPEWDSDSSSVDALSSASERGPHTRQQKSPCAEQRQPRAQPQARRQRRPPHSDDGESTLSDSSSDNDFVLPRARSPAAVRDRPRRSTTTSEKKKPAARFAQSSSDSDSDMEDGAVFPEQRRQRQQPQSDNGESSDSSSDNNFVSPHSTDPATPRASSRHSGTQRDRQMHARTAETAAAAARRPTVASIVDQPAQQSDTLKKPSTTLKLLPSRSVQSASPTVAMQRVRQHSDLRASANSDAGPHVEEWLALPDARARTGKGVQGQRGQGGEELIRQLAATLREREPSEENSFIDPDFPPQNTSLYKDSEAVGGMREGAPLDSVGILHRQRSVA
eukprot:COSAG02_NODE_833_length_16656_cov_42.746814_8_plen_520_part_00